MDNIKEYILEESKKGNIVVSTFEGLQIGKLSDIIDQPVEGLLYDLNRDTGTILTFLDDPKWVNDYACMQVIIALKERIKELENINNPKDEVDIINKFEYKIIFFTIEELNDLENIQLILNTYINDDYNIISETPNKDGLYLLLKRLC